MPGRKVYRIGASNRKRHTKRLIIFLIIIIAAAALVFLSISVVRPIINYFQSRGEAYVTEAWTPPVTSTTNDESSVKDEDVTEASEAEGNSIAEFNGFSAYKLPIDALSSKASLAKYLEQIKASGFTAAEVELKSDGGSINYLTASPFAQTSSNAIQGAMTANEIASIIKEAGFKPICRLSLVNDNNKYGEFRTGSYRTTDGDTWLDNSPANGGKPWLSPFEKETVDFAKYLSNETAAAGFEIVIASGLDFPTFRNSDVGYLGAAVVALDRYKALLNVANAAREGAESGGAEFYLHFDADEILEEANEAFRPDELNGTGIIVDYNAEALPKTVVLNDREVVLTDMTAGEKASAVFGIIGSGANNGFTIIPCISHESLNQSEYNEVLTTIISLGYNSYIVE